MKPMDRSVTTSRVLLAISSVAMVVVICLLVVARDAAQVPPPESPTGTELVLGLEPGE